MDPKKIKSIEDWPTPTSVTDIRSFLRLADYYRKFIESFLRIACPMNALKNKENKSLWKTKCEESFQILKQLLTTAPILQFADLNGDFVVFIDASKEGLGGVERLHVLLWITKVEETWTKLPHPWSWVSNHYPRLEYVEALPYGEEIPSKNRQYKSELFIWATGFEFQSS